MIVSIHQPNYIPWTGFFQKMTLCDQFVLLDNVPFSKNSYQNRCRIKTLQGIQWLTVPVSTSGHFAQATNLMEINQGARFARKHWRTIESNYRKAPYFRFLADQIEPVFTAEWTLLAELNTALIVRLAGALGFTTPLLKASSLDVAGSSSVLLCDICRVLGADEYLSGPSGRNYLDLNVFDEPGIKVSYHKFSHPVYPQLYGEFAAGLSVMDLLANCGPESGNILRGQGVRSC